jgi:cobalt-zinc-cadmium efflux system protein
MTSLTSSIKKVLNRTMSINDHSHHKNHHHSHHHHHAHGEAIGRMKVALILNFSFACIELVGGYLTNSVAIMSDALHDFGDSIAMAFAIFLEKFSHRKSDNRFSYGYRRFSTLGALVTGFILVVGSILILATAIPRILNPEQPHADGMILLALLGLLVNGFAAYKISKGDSLNERMLMWHMLEDVMGWAMVLVGGVIIKFYDIPQLDAVMAIILSSWILYNVFKNLREAFQVFLMATPSHIQIEDIEVEILKNPLVESIHHGHLWTLDGEKHIFTAHVVLVASATFKDMAQIKKEIKKTIKNFGVVEATIETEIEGTDCFDPTHN